MKYCVYCGTSVTENYKFCPNCGKIIQPEGAEIEETTSAASAPSEETPSIQEELVSVDAAESAEEAKTETAQIPVSEVPVQEKSSKSLIGIACAVVGVLILAIVVFAVVVMLQQNKDDSSAQSTGDNVVSSPVISEDTVVLPALSEFEALMTNAVIDFYDEIGIDAAAEDYLLKDYKVYDTSKSMVHEHMFSYTYGPKQSFCVAGTVSTVHSGKVDSIYTYTTLPNRRVNEDTLAEIAPTLMIPAALFDDKYSNLEGIQSLYKKIEQMGTRDGKYFFGTLIINNIEYTLEIETFDGLSMLLSFTIDAEDVVDSSENVSNPSNDSNASYSANWKAEYADVLDNTMIEYPNYQYSCNYALYDIDKNGVPEMFVKVGTCETDYIYGVYAMSEAADDAVLIDILPADHTSVCGLQTKGSFLLWGGHMGYEWISKVTLSNNKFNEELIFEAEVVNYHELTPIDTYELNDRSGLNWSGNLAENNQQILDSIL